MTGPRLTDPSMLALASGPGVRPTERDAWGPGVSLAVVAHGLLIAALAWGVSWRSHQVEAVEAEMWSSVPVAETPRPPEPQPVATPQPQVAPTPPEETVPDLVIAKRKAPKVPPEPPKRREVEVFDSTPPKPRKPDPRDVAAQEAADKAAAKAAKDAAKEQARRDRLAREQAEQAEQLRLAKEQAALEAQRQRNLSDIVRSAGGGAGNSGAATGGAGSGPSAAYAGRLKALFKRNLNWAFDDVPGNPETVVKVQVAADGTILSRVVVTPSGSAAWDDAVVRAIDRTEVLPRDENGRVQPAMTLHFRMKDY